MILETFDIKNENSQEYARLNTYLISHSDSIKNGDTPVDYFVSGEEAIGDFRNGREKCLHCNLWQQDFMQLSCGILQKNRLLFPTALLELAKSVELVRKHTQKEWYVDPDKIVREGCSAGGHLAASYGVFWHEIL